MGETYAAITSSVDAGFYEDRQLAQARFADFFAYDEDLLMPRLNGFDVCAQLKRNAASRAVPVIVLTSPEADEAEVEVRRRGADSFLRKPFHCDTLRDHVRALLPKTLNP